MNPLRANIRQYQKQDKAAVVELLRLNTPQYFSKEEEKDLIFYLENEIEAYFVVEWEGKIVGCGGINFPHEKTTAFISWDIIHPHYQGNGLGALLLKYRILLLKTQKEVTKIVVRTSQHTHLFYQKGGFRLTEVIVDYWALGFDLYKMEYEERQRK
ncbi:MAG: GNAT family N-acetyltransferase [Bacteroidia bacterium]